MNQEKAGKIYVPDEVIVFTRMSRFKKNAKSWKYEFKPRTGVFKRLYETIPGKVSFGGYDSSLSAEEIYANA